MNDYRRPTFFSSMPLVVKNLLIINIIMALATLVFYNMGVDLNELLGLHHWSSPLFQPFQLVTYMFMHAHLASQIGFFHIFFNMYALWMFGRILEQVWGPKRFLIYYMVTGLGAGLIQLLVNTYELSGMQSLVYEISGSASPEAFAAFIDSYVPERYLDLFNKVLQGWALNPESTQYQAQAASLATELLELKRDVGTVGASGSVYGVLLAFGMLLSQYRIVAYLSSYSNQSQIPCGSTRSLGPLFWSFKRTF